MARNHSNKELVETNQKLMSRCERLTASFQQTESQNVQLRERCIRLQNRIDELKAHLSEIKSDVGQRVTPMKLIASHLEGLAEFLQSLDGSIDVEPTSEIGTISKTSGQKRQPTLSAIPELPIN